MNNPVLIGRDDVGGIDLYLIEASRLEDIPPEIVLNGSDFACLVAMDPNGISDDALAGMARSLLVAGCAYFCAWGPDSDRVHHAFDHQEHELMSTIPRAGEVVTDSRGESDFPDAIWYMLNGECVDTDYFKDFRAVLLITIGYPELAVEGRTAFRNPQTYCDRVLERDEKATQSGRRESLTPAPHTTRHAGPHRAVPPAE